MNLRVRRDNLLALFFRINLPYLVLGVTFVDQLTKLVAGSILPVVCNGGAAFGIRAGGNVVTLAVLILVLLLTRIEKNRRNLSALILVFAGGISNFIDKIYFGCVRDFIDLRIFPVFNFADVAVCAGVVLLVYLQMFGKNEKA